MGFISGEFGFCGIVCASFGVEGRGTPVADSGGWGVDCGGENFTYAPTISYNIIMRCNSAELIKKGTQYVRTYTHSLVMVNLLHGLHRMAYSKAGQVL